MQRLQYLKSVLIGGASVLTLLQPAAAKVFNIPDGDLSTALDTYMQQSGVQIFYLNTSLRGHKSPGARGDYSEIAALTQVLRGTGFTAQAMPGNIISIVPQKAEPLQVAQAARRAPAAPMAVAPTAVETVVVTAQKKSENIQQVPISVTALSQAQLTDRQIAAGPDLIRDVPNMNFTKTNFTGYNIELRGIGTQAISVTTDPAVAVAYNGIPFLRNHFFEQEFFDLDNVEVLRGPQGTLYGRNATAGVVNLIPARPTDQFEAMASADIGNYSNRRFEGMINLPIVGDKLDVRVAGEWTKRDGYTENTTLNTKVDGRDLWSGRISIGFKPTDDLQTYLVWEHFSEDDDRLRSGKQLCKTAYSPTSVDGVPVPPRGSISMFGYAFDPITYLNQGCVATSLYSPDAFEVPNGFSAQYVKAGKFAGVIDSLIDPYAGTTQSTNLRDIQSVLLPHYRAKNDLIEFNADYKLTPALTLTSQTGYNKDFLYSTEDFNRFDTSPGLFLPGDPVSPTGVFCDPQLGCTNRLVGEDLSDENAWQVSQEIRLASNFSGPLNFNVGANFLHYETEENYYVFINTLTLYSIASQNNRPPYVPGVFDNTFCMKEDNNIYGFGFDPVNPKVNQSAPANYCDYIDPNPLSSINNMGHNYFLSQNPYTLNSYAAFGETYYNILPDLKLTTGLRLTEDRKHFVDIPSEIALNGWGYWPLGSVDQSWDRLTGRAALDWTPRVSFTDQTLIYGSYAHGYKAGGANPPGAALIGGAVGDIRFPDHPLTFKPEYIEAFELGTKNTLLDGSLTLNGDIFYYNYTGYQISEIVDRTAINNNYNAHVEGAEIESNWEPLPGLKFNFAGGWEDTAAAAGDSGIDLMDRTASNPNWIVVKPYPTEASNCILPTYVVAAMLQEVNTGPDPSQAATFLSEACGVAYNNQWDPLTYLPYVPNPTVSCRNCSIDGSNNQLPPVGYIGFNPLTAPNNGEGFSKNLSGHKLPNAPPFTVSFGTQYTIPVTDNWAATLRGDFYWQADSWARIFNDNPYDRIRGYTNVNLALILMSDDGWQVMGYVKNVFNTTAITGDFLNSDDSQLTTNVFLTDPRLYGVRITKNFGGGDTGAMADVENWLADLFADADHHKPTLWITLGGEAAMQTGQGEPFTPPFVAANPNSPAFKPTSVQQIERPQLFTYDKEARITFEPEGSDWNFLAQIQYGRTVRSRNVTDLQPSHCLPYDFPEFHETTGGHFSFPIVHGCKLYQHTQEDFSSTQTRNSQSHALIDFLAGKDVGIGMLGAEDSSTVDFGVRIAQFGSQASSTIHGRPDLQHYRNKLPSGIVNAIHNRCHCSDSLYKYYTKFHTAAATGRVKRSFKGIGPTISWNNSLLVVGDTNTATVNFDWGANAALLFGRQKVSGQHQESGNYFQQKYGKGDFYTRSASIARSRTVIVPNVGGFAGVSVNYLNAKVSLGYRGDFFFNAMDGGWDQEKSKTVGLFGPYANLSIGF